MTYALTAGVFWLAVAGGVFYYWRNPTPVSMPEPWRGLPPLPLPKPLSWMQRRYGMNWLEDAFIITGLCLGGLVFAAVLLVGLMWLVIDPPPATFLIVLLLGLIWFELMSKK